MKEKAVKNLKPTTQGLHSKLVIVLVVELYSFRISS